MDDSWREEVFPEKVFREYVSQRDGWRESYEGRRTPDQLGKDTAKEVTHYVRQQMTKGEVLDPNILESIKS